LLHAHGRPFFVIIILYATLAIAFTLLCVLTYIYCAYRLSKHGDVSTWLKQQAVDVRLY
jgi:uncharacterized membrane protein